MNLKIDIDKLDKNAKYRKFIIIFIQKMPSNFNRIKSDLFHEEG